jgi:hypothetical protein
VYSVFWIKTDFYSLTCRFEKEMYRLVPDTASYIRGWIQMVLAPNDLFSWNNTYNKYNEYNITDTFTCFFLTMHTTYSVHAGILKPWRGRLPLPIHRVRAHSLTGIWNKTVLYLLHFKKQCATPADPPYCSEKTTQKICNINQSMGRKFLRI